MEHSDDRQLGLGLLSTDGRETDVRATDGEPAGGEPMAELAVAAPFAGPGELPNPPPLDDVDLALADDMARIRLAVQQGKVDPGEIEPVALGTTFFLWDLSLKLQTLNILGVTGDRNAIATCAKAIMAAIEHYDTVLDRLNFGFLRILLAHDIKGMLEPIQMSCYLLSNPSGTYSFENVFARLISLLNKVPPLIEDIVASSCYYTEFPLAKTPINLKDFFETRNEAFTKAGSGMQVRILAEGDYPSVDIHEGTLGNLIANMIRNARHHGKASMVIITLSKTADHIELTIQDDGKGIGPAVEDVAQIYKRGFSSNSHLITHGGIGLADAAERAKASGFNLLLPSRHGGIYNETTGQTGAGFTFTFPIGEN